MLLRVVPRPPQSLVVERSERHDHLLRVHGPLDAAGLAELRRVCLRSATTPGLRTLTLDLVGVPDLDEDAARAIVAAHRVLMGGRRVLRIARPSLPVYLAIRRAATTERLTFVFSV